MLENVSFSCFSWTSLYNILIIFYFEMFDIIHHWSHLSLEIFGGFFFFLSVCVRMVSMLEYNLHIVKFTLSINMMSCVNHSQDKEHMSISKHRLVAAGSQSPPTYLSF